MQLTRLRARARETPRAVAFLILGLFTLVMVAPLLVLGPLDVTAGTGLVSFDTLISGIPWQMGITTLLLLALVVLGWFDIAAFPRRMHPAAKRPLVATAAFPIVGIITFTLVLFDGSTGRNPFEILILVLILNFFVGLSEELLFRGFLFGALRRKNTLLAAIVVSSIAFGLLHLVNAGVGQDLAQTLFQVLNAAALGVLFCGLVLQGASLWPAIILHMIWNCYAMMGVAVTETLTTVPGAPVEAPPLTPWNLILPAVVLIIGAAVLRGYCLRTGANLLRVIPSEP